MDLNGKIAEVMDGLNSAMWQSGADVDRIEDAIAAWRDRVVNDELLDPDVVETMADVVTDALRQAHERAMGFASVRIVPEPGARISFSWLADRSAGVSAELQQTIRGAVDSALKAGKAAA